MHTTFLDSFFDKQQLSELSKAFELSGARTVKYIRKFLMAEISSK